MLHSCIILYSISSTLIQADVYINSTNPQLDLSHGELSQALVKACGDQLKEEAKQSRPLHPTQVAVTSAGNLKANAIYHVSLPDHSVAGSETVRFYCVPYLHNAYDLPSPFTISEVS